MHKETIHEVLKKYKCDKCGKQFAKKDALTSHIRGVHAKIQKLNCCQKSFSKGFNLKEHIQNVHEKEKEIFTKFCKKGFGKLQHLKSYSVLHKKKFCTCDFFPEI